MNATSIVATEVDGADEDNSETIKDWDRPLEEVPGSI